MSQPSPPPLGTECLSCRSNGSWDDWSGGEETRVVIEPTACAGLHIFVHAYTVWLYSKGDSRTLGTTLTWPIVGPCRMPVTLWHEWWGPEVNNKRAQRELNPTPAYCHTSFPQICTRDVVFTLSSPTEVQTKYWHSLHARIPLFSQWGSTLSVFVLHTTDLFQPWHFPLRRGKAENFRHLRNKLQEETYLCAFPSWELSSFEEFWFFMLLLAACVCVHSCS